MLRKLSFVKNNKNLIINYFSLSSLKAINILFPLINLPYLVRVLGPDGYGKISFAIVFIQYLILFSNYGFLFSGTKAISENRNNLTEISKIFSSIIIIRIILMFISFLILLIFVTFIKKFNQDPVLYYYGFGMLIGDVLFPVWFFQGMEKMKYITIINFISKLTFTFLIFVFIKEASHYKYVPLFYSFGFIISGIIGLFYAYYKFKLKILFPSSKFILSQLNDGYHLFISTLSINIYRNINVLLLGFWMSDAIIGYYAASEKLIKAVQSIFTPISDTLFPYFSNRFKTESQLNNFNQIKKISSFLFPILLSISILILLFAKPIVIISLGNNYHSSISNLQILSFVIVFGGMNYFLGFNGLVNFGYKKVFSNYVILSGVSSILTIIIFHSSLYDNSASLAMLVSETILFLLILIKFRTIKAKII